MNNLNDDLQSYIAGASAIPRLSAAGLKGLNKLSPVQIAALGGMSDSELSLIAKTQSLGEFDPFPDPGSPGFQVSPGHWIGTCFF